MTGRVDYRSCIAIPESKEIPTKKLADCIRKASQLVSMIFHAKAPKSESHFWQRSARQAEKNFARSYQDLTAATSKAKDLSSTLYEETCKISSEQSAAVSRDVSIPMIREAIKARDLLAKQVERKAILPATLREIDYLIHCFGEEAFSVNIKNTPTPQTSAPAAIAAIREQREKLDAFETAAEDLKKIK